MTLRKRTINSFLASLIIHLLLLLKISGILSQLYIRPEPKPKPLPQEITEVEIYHTKPSRSSLGRTDLVRKASSFSKRQSLQNLDIKSLNQPETVKQNLISTHTKLNESNKSLLSMSKDSKEQFESIKEPDTRVKANTDSVQVIRGYASQKGGTGKGSGDDQIGSALKDIGGQIVTTTSDKKIDVIFLIDTSGSMVNNIHSVARNLGEMMYIFQESNIDYRIGITKFKYSKLLFFPLTSDYKKYERLLMNVKCGGDERTYNAIVESAKRVKFRPDSTRRFILITDEEFKGSYSIIQVIDRLREANIILDIIGLDSPLQKNLARQTGGTWHLIPKSDEDITEKKF